MLNLETALEKILRNQVTEHSYIYRVLYPVHPLQFDSYHADHNLYKAYQIM